MAYYKPQSPIKIGENHIYPLTTVDQIMMDDGGRLNAKVITGSLEQAEDDNFEFNLGEPTDVETWTFTLKDGTVITKRMVVLQ